MGEGRGQGTLPWDTLRGEGKTQEICSPPLRRPFPSWVRLKPFEIRHKRPSLSFSGGREGRGGIQVPAAGERRRTGRGFSHVQ